MDLKQLVGTDAYYRRDDGTEMTHKDFYDSVIEKLGGVDKIIPCLPADLLEITLAIQDDPHLNNIPLKRWEVAAGFVWEKQTLKQEVNTRLRYLLNHAGVTVYSSSEAVNILKAAARQWSVLGHLLMLASKSGTYRIGYKDPSITGDKVIDSRTEFYADGDSEEEIWKDLYDLWDSFCKASNIPVTSAAYVEFVTEQEI